MKRILMLLIILSSLGTGCGAKDGVKTAPKEESASGATEHAVRKPDGEALWMDAYFKIVKEQGDKAEKFQLVDIDLDGIPELFLFRKVNDYSVVYNIYHGYSYKDGTVSDIRIPSEAKWSSLNLYKNRDNGELIWMAEGLDTPEKGRNECSRDEVDFSDFSNVKQTALLEWAEVRSKDSSGSSQMKYFMLPDNTEVAKKELDEAKKELAVKYEDQRALCMSSLTNKLMAYTPDIKSIELSKSLFYPFVRLYDETAWENEQKADDPLYLHVYFIRSEITTGYDNKGGFPVSVIRKFSWRLDDGKLRLLWTDQVNLHPSITIHKVLNKTLSSWALSALSANEGRRGVQIFQNAYVYEKYLSVLQEVRYNDEDTGSQKKNYSAKIINMETGEDAKLDELAEFDNKLKDKIYAGDFSNKRFTHAECLEQGIYDKLWSLMQNPDLKNQFYMNRSNFGFILEIAPNDTICFEIPIHELQDSLNLRKS